MGIHEQRTGTGHHGSKEGLGADERERVVEAGFVLRALWESRCRGQEEEEEDQREMPQKRPYLSRPIVRIDLPTFAGLGFPR